MSRDLRTRMITVLRASFGLHLFGVITEMASPCPALLVPSWVVKTD